MAATLCFLLSLLCASAKVNVEGRELVEARGYAIKARVAFLSDELAGPSASLWVSFKTKSNI